MRNFFHPGATLLVYIYLKVLAKIYVYFYTASMEYLHNVCSDISRKYIARVRIFSRPPE